MVHVWAIAFDDAKCVLLFLRFSCIRFCFLQHCTKRVQVFANNEPCLNTIRNKGVRKGWVGLNPLFELDMSQKLYCLRKGD